EKPISDPISGEIGVDYYYVADRPGYDTFFVRDWHGPGGIISNITVLNYDGSLPEQHAPIAQNDHVVIRQLDAFTISPTTLGTNDFDQDGDFVSINGFHSLSTNLFVDVVLPEGLAFYSGVPNVEGWIDSGYYGISKFAYSLVDGYDNVSNDAIVTLEIIGTHSTSVQNIIGTEANETFDFTLADHFVDISALGGNDLVRGSMFADTLRGGDGSDQIGGKDGDDAIYGGDGDDSLWGDVGNDLIEGGAGLNFIDGGAGNDLLRGGGLKDTILGGIGDDQIGGKGGNDWIDGGDGVDVIYGDEGNDLLFGGAGNDALNGGAGNDILVGGMGADRMRGGAGNDTYVLTRGEIQGDRILDFDNPGALAGDKLDIRGYSADATLAYLGGGTWKIADGGTAETFSIDGVTSLSQQDYFFAV
ncbi:calcium-binding protein, partial [Methylobacterium sp. Leaf113]|uniref:calcium-binding protein n=1 Tax=Methylobacterium sp. Leaf113 TaxID=1736259 RepID=UPI000A4E5E31